jgi:hypothetical protein
MNFNYQAAGHRVPMLLQTIEEILLSQYRAELEDFDRHAHNLAIAIGKKDLISYFRKILVTLSASSHITTFGDARVLANSKEHDANHGHSGSFGTFVQASRLGGCEGKSPIGSIGKLTR